jgi:hypothetical protein
VAYRNLASTKIRDNGLDIKPFQTGGWHNLSSVNINTANYEPMYGHNSFYLHQQTFYRY